MMCNPEQPPAQIDPALLRRHLFTERERAEPVLRNNVQRSAEREVEWRSAVDVMNDVVTANRQGPLKRENRSRKPRQLRRVRPLERDTVDVARPTPGQDN